MAYGFPPSTHAFPPPPETRLAFVSCVLGCPSLGCVRVLSHVREGVFPVCLETKTNKKEEEKESVTRIRYLSHPSAACPTRQVPRNDQGPDAPPPPPPPPPNQCSDTHILLVVETEQWRCLTPPTSS